MNRLFKFTLMFFLLISIYSCKSASSDKSDMKEDNTDTLIKNVIPKKEVLKTNDLLNNPLIYSNLVDTNKTIDMECTRGQAEPILDKDLFPISDFKLLKDSISGLEATLTADSELLVIKNWGCEYYILSFTFFINNTTVGIDYYKFWYQKAFDLMKANSNGFDSPIDIETGLDSLNMYFANTDSSKLEIDHELYYGMEDMPNYIVLDDIQRIDNKILLTVTVAIGPL